MHAKNTHKSRINKNEKLTHKVLVKFSFYTIYVHFSLDTLHLELKVSALSSRHASVYTEHIYIFQDLKQYS